MGICWRVEDGCSIRVFDDPWLPRPHTFKPITPKNNHDMNWYVRDLITNDEMVWNDRIIDDVFLDMDKDVIFQIPLSIHRQWDTMIWHFDKKGIYIVRSGYKAMINSLVLDGPSEASKIRQLDDSDGLDVHDKNEKWHPLELGLLKLNVDVAVNSGEGIIGVGAVIKDYKGDIMGVMAKRIKGYFDPYISECFAIREGLAFTKKSILHVRILETDSLRMLNALGRYD
ncbi:hypothetical protein TorRG33x02_354290, partial [Trema orientale]